MTTARLTFREKAGAVCWQKQLRDRYASEGTPPVPHLDVKGAVVRPVSRKVAEQVILKYEWLGTMPNFASSFKRQYGIFFGPYCAGVTCVTCGGSGGINVPVQFGLGRLDVAILTRGACTHWAPTGTNSRLVAWTCRLLSRESRCKLVLAYSDTDAGEVGTIYQACNWVYVGTSATTRQWVAPNGRVYDQKYPWDRARQFGGTRAEWVQRLRLAGWAEQVSNPKYKYVYVLDRSDVDLVSRVERMRLPYPKRATSIGSDAPANHAGQGGATPTVALSPFARRENFRG